MTSPARRRDLSGSVAGLWSQPVCGQWGIRWKARHGSGRGGAAGWVSFVVASRPAAGDSRGERSLPDDPSREGCRVWPAIVQCMECHARVP